MSSIKERLEKMEVAFDTKEFVIIDNGTGFVKAGISGEDLPRVSSYEFPLPRNQKFTPLHADRGSNRNRHKELSERQHGSRRRPASSKAV